LKYKLIKYIRMPVKCLHNSLHGILSILKLKKTFKLNNIKPIDSFYLKKGEFTYDRKKFYPMT